jgi:hypothetical protein
MKIENVVRRIGVQKTKFTEWMEANKKFSAAGELKYGDFPTKFVCPDKSKMWK